MRGAARFVAAIKPFNGLTLRQQRLDLTSFGRYFREDEAAAHMMGNVKPEDFKRLKERLLDVRRAAGFPQRIPPLH